jgi:cold shock CspA family protein
LEQYQQALVLDEKAVEVKLEMARLFMFMCRFSDAEKSIAEIDEGEKSPPWLSRKTCDLRLQLFERQASASLHEHDHESALRFLERLAKSYQEAPLGVSDRHIAYTLQRASSTGRLCLRRVVGPDRENRAKIVVETLRNALIALGFDIKGERSEKTVRGEIIRTVPASRYAFLKGEDGEQYFLHFTQIINFDNANPPIVGDRVSFCVGRNKVGPCAMNCFIEDRA